MNQVATCYASALFGLAKEDNKVDVYLEELGMLKTVLACDRDIMAFFQSLRVSEAQKMAVLNHSLGGRVDKEVLSFLKLLVKKKRMAALAAICDDYKRQYQEDRGIVEGIIYSALPLDTAYIARIEAVMSQKEQKKVQLQCRLDPSLIGGIRVEIARHVYDGSLEARLSDLKAELLRK